MPRTLVKKNRFATLEDLQRALSSAAAMGFADHARGAAAKPTGLAIAERLLVTGSWVKKQEKSLKSAYLAGYDHHAFNGSSDVESSDLKRKK